MKGKSSNFIAFDIGSSKIAALAASISKTGEVTVNSQILQHSEGLKSGFITNMELAENSIISAIYALEQYCNKSIKEVAISISGSSVKSYYIDHKIKIGNQAITKQDIKRLTSKALLEFKLKDQQIIHHFPLEFTIDDKQIVENPLGMYARELSCQLHIVSVDSFMLMNLNKCLEKCHVEVCDVFLSIYSSAIACLNKDEKQLGAIIIDIGSNSSSFGIFFNNNLVYAGHVASGSMDITNQIAKEFSISIAAADKLKILYGSANSKIVRNNVLRLDEIDSENEYNSDLSITTIELARIIESKTQEIFIKIKQQCDRISIDHLLSKRVVITGGCAALSGLSIQASEIFQKQVRIAKPEIISGFAETYNSHMYSTVIGMVKAKCLKFQKNSFRHGLDEDLGLFKKVLLWLKENI
jgi:cell division protein FtsA